MNIHIWQLPNMLVKIPHIDYPPTFIHSQTIDEKMLLDDTIYIWIS